ncbi:Sybindin-like protein [Polychaeton citri CBS 116435]|uniref:Trafficking protein particle complex subunit n=1 Tax=Polychaeton citri CBS 116435 TaxID=1314669 RepID=A0A9P4QDT6_9PEZI|nr:Sybindin-like protein [Polychaeton citri CBS 116435]
MVVFALLIINKAGGLVYTRTFSPGLQKLDSNDYLILAGTFHGIHAISKTIAPSPPSTASSTPAPSTATAAIPSTGPPSLQQQPGQVPALSSTTSSSGYRTRRPQATGIESLESSHFRLTCFQTQTGVKFLLFTSPEQPNADTVVRRCYELYAEFVMRNPFYSLEMPIRVGKFDRALGAYLARP